MVVNKTFHITIERKGKKNEKISTELCEDNGEETREESDEV